MRVFWVGVWYTLLIAVIGGALWFMPNSWRIHPSLVRPILLKKGPEIKSDTLLIGECHASLAPKTWKAERYVIGHMSLEVMPAAVRKNERIDFTKYKNIVILAGTREVCKGVPRPLVESQLQSLRRTLRARAPKAKIYVISPYELNRISCMPGYGFGDGAHITAAGFAYLKSLHPELLDISQPQEKRE